MGFLDDMGISLPTGASVSALTEMLLWAAIAAGVVFIIFIFIRNIIIFKFPIIIYSRRGNSRKVRYGKGGYVKKRGMRTFRLKWGKISMPWMKKDLDFLPDTNLMEADGRLHFDQLDPDTYAQKKMIHYSKPTKLRIIRFLKGYEHYNIGDMAVQYEHIANDLIKDSIAEYIDSEKDQDVGVIEVEDTYSEPIPRDQKQLAVQEIKLVDQALKDDTLKKWMIGGGILFFVVLVIFGVIFLFNQ